MAKMGRPRHVASSSDIEDAQDMLLLDRFLAVPSFTEHGATTYTREQMIKAVMGYVLTGSSRKASQISGVPDTNIRRWKCDNTWWDDCILVAKEILSEKFEDKFTALLNETLSQLSSRLDKGDVIMRDGELVTVPVKAAELSRILSILFDRRQLLRGDVTSRTETRSNTARLKELKEIAEDLITKSNA